MDESLNIVRHFFNTYNTNPGNDHWYPQVHHTICIGPTNIKDTSFWPKGP